MNSVCRMASNCCSVNATVKDETGCRELPHRRPFRKQRYVAGSLTTPSGTIDRLMSFADAIVIVIKIRILEKNKINTKNNLYYVASGRARSYSFKYSTSFFRKYSFGSSVEC